MSSVVCLSHREDVDGILSAALIKAVSKTKRIQIVLADYANIISKLQKISAAASDSNLENANPTTKEDSNRSNNNSGSGSISPTSTSTSTSTTTKIGIGKPQRLFICDLGLSKKTEDKFLGLLKEIISKGIKVTYFDHH